MNFSFEETPDSREETAEPPTFTYIYKASGETDDLLVQQYALAATPISVFRPSGVLYRQDIRKKPAGHAQYIVTVPYRRLSVSALPTGSSTFSFDTQGATVKIKASNRHIASYPDDGDWHKGAINVNEDGNVEGTDIIIPALKLTYSFTHPQGVVNESFARLLASATGCTNLNPFRTFEASELLFLGGSGSDGTASEATVNYNFAASSNQTNLTIGEITGILKKGHEYVWIEFEDEVSEGEAVRRPKRVHVEEVYNAIDFANIFGWN